MSVGFRVAWENSWRTSTNESNYDGAWVFIKFRKNGTSEWRHCTLDGTAFSASPGSDITVPTDRKGAFLHRASDGIGDVDYAGNSLTWAYGEDGVLDNDSVQVKVFAIEMVYIPAGAYYLGSGGSEVNCFRAGATNSAFLVTGPAAIPLGNTAGSLNLNSGGAGTLLPATYPNGYAAYWIMKYESSQQQFADFLNHLMLAQATPNYTSSNFTGSTHPAFQPLVADRAYNDLGIAQATAFADWAALRPFSELEFEKACRGVNIQPVMNEYVWGSTTITQLLTLQNDGLVNEDVGTPLGANAVYRNSNGSGPIAHPVRVGLFARTTGSTRELSGATYYGLMNMGDNLHEFCIYAGSVSGQAIDASIHGDGYLDAAGATDIGSWASASAFGVRGGRYYGGATTNNEMRTSDRTGAGNASVGGGSNQRGIRLARTAP
ncbi:MAG: hypothetical protein IPP83_17940 [Flavobacteriales bacterium]|nr:hypothetical protein [Flavobacteriales bacterium]